MLAVGMGRGAVQLVDVSKGMVRWGVSLNSAVRTVAMSPDGRFVASVGESEENWTLWDARSGGVSMTGARHDGSGACTCTMSAGRFKSLDGACPVQAHTSGLLALAFSPCGQRLATGGKDSAVILWDARTGKAERVLQGRNSFPETSSVCSISISADGARVASAGYDTLIRVWDAITGAALVTMRGIRDERFLSWVHFSPSDGRRLATLITRVYAPATECVQQWNIDSGPLQQFIEGRTFAVFSPDGLTIATAGASGSHDVLLVDAETGAVRLTLHGHLQNVYTASWNLEGSKLASGCFNGACKVWDTSTGALLNTIELGRWICTVSWTRDWLRDAKCVAFSMGLHPRLGAGSEVLALDEGLLPMILDRL